MLASPAAPSGGGVTGPVAQFGRNPWVRDTLRLRIPKGVIVGRKVCAELLALSHTERMNDRIANGTPPTYDGLRGICAASLASFSHSRDVRMVRMLHSSHHGGQ